MNISLTNTTAPYQKEQSYSDVPKIVIFNFPCKFPELLELQSSLGIEVSNDELLEILISIARDKGLFEMLLQVELFSIFNFITNNAIFSTELERLKSLYTAKANSMLKELTALGCYKDGKMLYHFACSLEDSAVVLHRVEKKDI